MDNKRDTFLAIIAINISIISLILIGLILRPMRAAMLPIIFSLFLFILLKPFVHFLKEKKVPSIIAVLLSILLLFIVANLIGFTIYTSLSSFVDGFPKYEEKIVNLYFSTINKLNIKHEDILKFDWESQLSNFSFTKIIGGLFGSIINFLGNLFIIFIILIYLLISESKLMKKIETIFIKNNKNFVIVVRKINNQIYAYLITKTAVSLITGFGAWLILSLYGVDFPIIWAVLTFLLNFIPNFGSLVATILPFLLAIVQFGNFSKPIWLLITLVSLQFTMGNLIEPKLMSENLNMSPVTVLVSLIFWGWLWGIQGMFIGIPITGILKIIFENIQPLKPIAIIMSNKIKTGG